MRTQPCQLLITQQKVERDQFWQNLAIMHFFAVFLGDSACNTRRMTMRGIQQGTGMWNLALWWTIASQRDFRRKLNRSLDPMLVSNIGLFAHLCHLTPISYPLRLYAILKLANSKNFRKVHSVLSNVTYCYKRSIFLHFILCKIRISKSKSSFPDRKLQYLVKFCRLFLSFCNVRGAEH